MNVVVACSAVTALIGSIAGGVWALEARMEAKFVPVSQFEKFYINNLQAQIRELERLIREEEDPRLLEILEEDLEGLLDEYCLEVEDPRRCDE
jgi:hypothetical protein